VHHIVGDRARAEELTQDAFIELLRHWRTVADYDRPDLWLRRVAIRKAQRERHRGWRGRDLEVLAAPSDTVDPPATPAPEVLEAVRRLAPGQRAVVVLFYLEDRPMSEIAGLLGIAESTGWSQLHTARKHLARDLHQEVTDAIN
jgi:RNA polymerase sigma-70 factor (ECF subfamily)